MRKRRRLGDVNMKRQASVARKVQFAGQVSNSLERHDWTGKLDHSITLT